jgi:hypothetical protein
MSQMRDGILTGTSASLDALDSRFLQGRSPRGLRLANCGPRVGIEARGNDSGPMLTALTTGLRFKLAIALAAFAALCFVAPPAVLAFGHGKNTVNCLAHVDAVDHGEAKAHGMKHHSDHSSPAGGHQMTCCGLFCLSALAAEDGETVDRIDAGPALSSAIEASPHSRVPERPDRPPISLLSV